MELTANGMGDFSVLKRGNAWHASYRAIRTLCNWLIRNDCSVRLAKGKIYSWTGLVVLHIHVLKRERVSCVLSGVVCYFYDNA